MLLLYSVVFGLLAHVLFWGAGLAMLAMPRPWLRFWPVLAAPAGFALQGLVVWCGAYANLPGTQSYAYPSELIPVLLLFAGLYRRRSARTCLLTDLTRLGWVWAAMTATLAVLAFPLGLAAKGLTTASLRGSDAADYAAGARVLQQFAHSDRSGFLGLTEVVRVMSVDNFFDFWLRLDHFTPSALIAFNGAIFHCQPHEIISAMGMVILAGSLPVVFWIARAVLGFRGGISAALAALYGFSPIIWYAVDGVALGQLLGALAIAIVTWAGIILWRYRLRGRAGWAWFAVLLIADSLIWGAYNFIVIVCLLPAVAYVAGGAAQSKPVPIRRLLEWCAWMALPLLFAGLVFWARVAGVIERFKLLRTYDLGWHIPPLSPEGWLGIVRGPELHAYPLLWRILLSALFAGLLGLALWRGLRAGRRSAQIAVCLLIPPLIGYAYLTWRGLVLGTNASFDAYKLFSAFYPVILPALWWSASSHRRQGSGGQAGRAKPTLGAESYLIPAFCFVAVANAVADYRFLKAMSAPPQIVDRDLIAVHRAEAIPQLDSFNLCIPEVWDRRWANQFLLKRPQYFSVHSYEGYEGRLDTPLRGHWDLLGGLISVILPGNDSVQIDRRYCAVKVASPYYLHAAIPKENARWYPTERTVRTSTVWQWASPSARLDVENPHATPLQVVFRFDVSSLESRELRLWNGDSAAAIGHVSPQRQWVQLAPVSITPGLHSLELRSNLPPTRLPGDGRALAFQIYAIELTVLSQ